MSDEKNKPVARPQVNDEYWFAKLREMLDEAPERINTSSENFEKLIIWLWGIYTTLLGLGSGAAKILWNQSYSGKYLWLLVAPSVLLLIAYWLATKARSSVVLKIKEHRAAGLIKKNYLKSLVIKNHFYFAAQVLTLLSCLSIPITIWLSNQPEKKIKPALSANLIEQ